MTNAETDMRGRFSVSAYGITWRNLKIRRVRCEVGGEINSKHEISQKPWLDMIHYIHVRYEWQSQSIEKTERC